MTQDVDEDAEIAAMAALKKLLDPLDDNTKERVLRWGAERFQLGIGVVKRKSADTNYRDRNEDNTNKYGTFAELFDAARPRSGSERGLVAGYWFQVVKGQATFSGNEV